MVFGIKNLMRVREIADLYSSQEVESIEKGIRANNFYKRVVDCLEADLQMPVLNLYQGIEERSPNHHKYIVAPQWPIGLIRINPIVPASRCKELSQYDEFRKLGLEIITASNSSGGVPKDKIYEYTFTIHPKEIMSYSQISKKILEEYGDEPEFREVNKQISDFIRLEGFDAVSEGRLIIEMGNTPSIKKMPIMQKERPIISGRKIRVI